MSTQETVALVKHQSRQFSNEELDAMLSVLRAERLGRDPEFLEEMGERLDGMKAGKAISREQFIEVMPKS